MLQINGKTFMNLQEAVQWLLDNNALPFQCSANYIANTEIGMGTIVNPSPAKVRIGSLIFFADSKVSTVIGLTENGFMVSDQYNDLVDDVVYVSNVELNASGHLVVTLSNGDTIDAGLVKQVSGFSIDASQHLIASYNDGTSTDLGAIFSGNVNISGNLTADSIIENMSGYSWSKLTNEYNWDAIYVGAVKNGNKLTLVVFGKINIASYNTNYADIGRITVPAGVHDRLVPYQIGAEANVLETKKIMFQNASVGSDRLDLACIIYKQAGNRIMFELSGLSGLTTNTTYYFRIETTFLLSNNLAS